MNEIVEFIIEMLKADAAGNQSLVERICAERLEKELKGNPEESPGEVKEHTGTYKTSEVAEMAGNSLVAVSAWARKNGIRKNGNCYMWTRGDVEEYMRRGRGFRGNGIPSKDEPGEDSGDEAESVGPAGDAADGGEPCGETCAGDPSVGYVIFTPDGQTLRAPDWQTVKETTGLADWQINHSLSSGAAVDGWSILTEAAG